MKEIMIDTAKFAYVATENMYDLLQKFKFWLIHAHFLREWNRIVLQWVY